MDTFTNVSNKGFESIAGYDRSFASWAQINKLAFQLVGFPARRSKPLKASADKAFFAPLIRCLGGQIMDNIIEACNVSMDSMLGHCIWQWFRKSGKAGAWRTATGSLVDGRPAGAFDCKAGLPFQQRTPRTGSVVALATPAKEFQLTWPPADTVGEVAPLPSSSGSQGLWKPKLLPSELQDGA
mmetsp:Transcript_73676/g.149044  ORF Transcript_73676/g.149044 Transcript_73676/m.149044 type:complete len:183 (+) Transcript_73676:65-613(+)